MRNFLFALVLILCATVARAEGEWTVLNPSNPPSNRFGYSMTTLPDGRVILMGGENSVEDICNDLYTYDNGEWNSLAPANSPPPSRRRHCGWQKDGKVYVQGGLGINSKYMSDLWNYDLATGKWQEVQTSGTKPSARHSHTATVLPDGGVLLLGGRDDQLPSDEAWKLNTDNTYTLLSRMPMRLENHTAQLVGDMVFVFGEPDTTFTYNITTNEWATVGVGPPLWGYATSAVGENEAGEKIIFVFGGIKKSEYESDIVYEYNTATNTISQRQERMPFTHSSGTAATLKSQKRSASLDVLFFGGKSNGQVIGTTFQFSTMGTPAYMPGDVNHDGKHDLKDVVLSIQVTAGISLTETVYKDADVDGDGKIGMAEGLYVLQVMAGLR